RFELTLQPQLILLQKTLLNIEGVGRMLDPEIDIWAVAHPVLKRILRERYSPLRTLRDIRKRLPEWLHHAPEFPELVRDALRQAGRGEQRALSDPLALKLQLENARRQHKLLACGLLGSSLLIGAVLLGTLAPQHGIWPPVCSGVAGLLAFAIGWPRSR
ncbi:MAG TPA: ubiquinone biosynthesis regulatory protein kinase UbiB, partial [Rhodanobacter sp.]|nr:ubiquinone biosynthesis regulatory protein kinase UbiB [Rhodanobacter sp.]